VCTIFLKVILDRTSHGVIYLNSMCRLSTTPCLIAIGAVIILFLAPFSARAEVYTYVDENDTVHFTNVPTDPQFKMIIRPKEEKPKAVSAASEKDQRGQKEFGRLIEAKSYQYGLDPALVKAVIAVESAFNPRAVSEKGARGLMQLMPMTADELGVTNSFDPEANIDGGARYLKYLLDYFNWDIDLALAAYHAGRMRVVRHTGIPPIPATHQYVKKVKKVYQKYILQ